MDIFIPLSFFLGIISSFIGSQVGGGGLLIVPYLLLAGLGPVEAIATHKTATIAGTATSFIRFFQKKLILWNYVIAFSILTITGELIGANILLKLDAEILEKVLGFILLIPLPFLFFKNLGLENKKISKLSQYFGYILFFLTSIWAGVFSPGAATLGLYTIVAFLGLTYIEASAARKLPSILAKISVLSLFIYADVIYWPYAIPMMLGYIIGSYAGVSFSIKKGNTWVRWLLVGVVLISSFKLLFF